MITPKDITNPFELVLMMFPTQSLTPPISLSPIGQGHSNVSYPPYKTNKTISKLSSALK